MLVYESLLKLDRLWLADFDPSIVGICTQPLQVTGLDSTAAVPDGPSTLRHPATTAP